MSSIMIIAELSANHGHRLEVAIDTVRAAKEAGADAIKLQTYTPDTITIDCDNDCFRINNGTIWDGKTYYGLYSEAYTPWEWHKAIQEEANKVGIAFFSTPFDFSAVDFLETLSVPMYKIASFEINDIPLIEYAAAKGKPMIISTGIADAGDIQSAVDACRRVGNNDITLLQCTSSYPAPVENANLRMIPSLAETFSAKSGLSDHTVGSSVAVAAAALGAVMIEKHFILDRSMGGPDAKFSMEPSEFRGMVEDIRTVEKALGKVDYSLREEKAASRKFSRSLFVVEDIPEGAEFTRQNVRSIRPNDGLPPSSIKEIIGHRASRNLKRGEPMKWNMVL